MVLGSTPVCNCAALRQQHPRANLVDGHLDSPLSTMTLNVFNVLYSILWILNCFLIYFITSTLHGLLLIDGLVIILCLHFLRKVGSVSYSRNGLSRSQHLVVVRNTKMRSLSRTPSPDYPYVLEIMQLHMDMHSASDSFGKLTKLLLEIQQCISNCLCNHLRPEVFLRNTTSRFSCVDTSGELTFVHPACRLRTCFSNKRTSKVPGQGHNLVYSLFVCKAVSRHSYCLGPYSSN